MKTTKKPLAISTLRVRNLKAIRDSGTVRFTPLTVFIGNNGVGKSSLIEGLETLQVIATEDLGTAMNRWRGFEYAINLNASSKINFTPDGRAYRQGCIKFDLKGTEAARYLGDDSQYQLNLHSTLAFTPATGEVFALSEHVSMYKLSTSTMDVEIERTSDGNLWISGSLQERTRLFPRDISIIKPNAHLASIQFLRMNTEQMAEPTPTSARSRMALRPDGSNVAQYLEAIRLYRDGSEIIDGIVETIQTILPYAKDIQPVITSEAGRMAYLQLTEGNFKVPSWLLSTGTLRLVALLAVLRHPDPAPLIAIEEIENGLDPRSIALIVEEIRNLVVSGRSQVILTTHSPYLLDLVPLESIIHVERVDGEPKFFRPADDERTRNWNEDFAPGRLYTMGRLQKAL